MKDRIALIIGTIAIKAFKAGLKVKEACSDIAHKVKKSTVDEINKHK